MGLSPEGRTMSTNKTATIECHTKRIALSFAVEFRETKCVEFVKKIQKKYLV